jgi:hypothetical protein
MIEQMKTRLQEAVAAFQQKRNDLQTASQDRAQAEARIRQLEMECATLQGQVNTYATLINDSGVDPNTVINRGPTLVPQTPEPAPTAPAVPQAAPAPAAPAPPAAAAPPVSQPGPVEAPPAAPDPVAAARAEGALVSASGQPGAVGPRAAAPQPALTADQLRAQLARAEEAEAAGGTPPVELKVDAGRPAPYAAVVGEDPPPQ